MTRSLMHLVRLCVFFLGVLVCGCSPAVVVPPPESTVPAPDKYADVSAILRQQYLQWRGVPHRIGGAGPDGVDCSGLVQAVYRRAFGIELPRTSYALSQTGVAVTLPEAEPGDILYFHDKRQGHVGILVEGHTFVHASASRGVILSSLDAYWLPRLLRIRRILP